MNFYNIKVSAKVLFGMKNLIRFRSSTTILEPTEAKISTVDEEEVMKHGKLASGWWDENGNMKALHSMNKLRIPFIRDGLLLTKGVDVTMETPKPLTGYEILDVGCGGGILCEPLARIGAAVTGLDAGSEVIEIAQKHAAEDPDIAGKIKYVCGKVEEHATSHKEKYDAVVASEVIEHVTEKELFVQSIMNVLKPGGSFFVTTVNRTMPAWVAGVITAEYVLHLLPENTHDWEKFITPRELQFMLERHDCHAKLIHGMFYNFICNEWYWTPNTAINYVLQAVKKK